MRSFAGPHTQPWVRAGRAGAFAGPPAPSPVAPDRPSPVGRPASASHNAVRYVLPPSCRGSPVPVCSRVPARSCSLARATAAAARRAGPVPAHTPRTFVARCHPPTTHPLPALDSLSHPRALHQPRADRWLQRRTAKRPWPSRAVSAAAAGAARAVPGPIACRLRLRRSPSARPAGEPRTKTRPAQLRTAALTTWCRWAPLKLPTVTPVLPARLKGRAHLCPWRRYA